MRSRRKLLVTGLAALVGVVGTEIGLRLAGIERRLPPTESGALTRPARDPELRHELDPGATQTRSFWSRRGALLREVEIAVNAHGFRGRPLDVPKPAGTFRIACLGDSQTFGDGVGEDDPWPVVLEHALRTQAASTSIDVLNAGVVGYDAEQEIAFLERRVLPYEPDLVVLGFFLNDTALPGTIAAIDEDLLSRSVHFFAPGRTGVYASLRAASRVLDLGSDFVFRRLAERDWLADCTRLFTPDFVGWRRAQAAILEGRTLVEARGGRLVVLLVPLMMRAGDDLASSAPYREVAAFCRAEGIACCDPAPWFAGVDVDRMRVDPRDPHTGALGNRVLGEGFARWLLDAGFLPGVSLR